MLDIQFIRENTDVVKQAAKNKNVDVDIDKLLKLDDQRRQLQGEIDQLRQQRNQLAGAGKKPSPEDVKKGQVLKDKIAGLDDELKKVEGHCQQLLLKVPNVPTQETPVGKSEADNKVLRSWGEQPKLDFKAKPHWELGKQLELIDSERAAKVSGSRFTFVKGQLALLQFALIQFVLAVLTDEGQLEKIIKESPLKPKVVVKPFVPILPPAMIRADVFERTGRLDPAEDKYRIEQDELYMVGSAEHTLVAMHMDEILADDQLPLRYLGYSTNFRREAGSYGKDVRGILRQHQFDKLEMESLVSPEDSYEEHKFQGAIQEFLMQQLQIPYRAVHVCTAEMGKPDASQIDIEAWLPSQNQYRETHTSDYMTDYQARGLNIKTKTKQGTVFVHTNDATALAMGRTLIAIMENYQTKEGKVKIPEVLKPYIKGSYL